MILLVGQARVIGQTVRAGGGDVVAVGGERISCGRRRLLQRQSWLIHGGGVPLAPEPYRLIAVLATAAVAIRYVGCQP